MKTKLLSTIISRRKSEARNINRRRSVLNNCILHQLVEGNERMLEYYQTTASMPRGETRLEWGWGGVRIGLTRN